MIPIKTKCVLIFLLCLTGQLKAQKGWLLEANQIDANHYYGITVANGMVGMVSSSQPMKIKDVVLNGVFDKYKRGRVSNILKTFSHMNMDLEVDGIRVGPSNIKNFKQVLDMKTAQLITTFEVAGKIKVENRLMSLRNMPYSAMSVVKVTALREVALTASNYIEAPDHLNGIRNYYSEIDRPHVRIPLLASEADSPGKKRVAAATSFIFSEPHESAPNVVHEEWDYNKHQMKFHKQLTKGNPYTFAVVGSTMASVHNKDPRNEVERLTIFARLEGIERMLLAHTKAWEELWKSDIRIEGDADAQLAVRSALYHLYAFARKGSGHSLSPMGLSGLGYNGHVFWDTELWMFPPLLVLQPNIAKSLLEYRFQRLEAAKENAFAHGLDGAMFPWESADDGSEATPVWALTGPFQQHISATVGWAFWKYFEVTKDKRWLADRGFPVLKEVADFWISRVERNGPGKYNINNVIGANEFEENIDNNAFTNGMVITVLRYAIRAAETLGEPVNPEWELVASNIPILTFPDGTTRENATYNGAIIKQADANLLSYPLKVVQSEEAVRRDLIYYEERISPSGPAMGLSIFATLYARLNQPEKAYELFQKSYQPNELPPFKVLAEVAGGNNPYFATGAGGMLQSVLFGFGGLEIGEEGIDQLDTKLPKKWTSLTITGVGIEKSTFAVE